MSNPKLNIVITKDKQDMSQGFRNWKYKSNFYFPMNHIVISDTEKGYLNIVGVHQKNKDLSDGDVVKTTKDFPDIFVKKGDQGMLVPSPEDRSQFGVEFNMGDIVPYNKENFSAPDQYNFSEVKGRSFKNIIVNVNDLPEDMPMDQLFKNIFCASREITLIGLKENIIKFIGQKNDYIDENELKSKASYVSGDIMKGIFWEINSENLSDKPIDKNEFRMPDDRDSSGYPIWL